MHLPLLGAVFSREPSEPRSARPRVAPGLQRVPFTFRASIALSPQLTDMSKVNAGYGSMSAGKAGQDSYASTPLMSAPAAAPAEKAAPGASTFTVDRATLLRVLRKRQERAAHCRSLPISIIMYALVCYTLIEHGRIGDSFSMETSLVDNVVYAGDYGFPDSVNSIEDWYAFTTYDFVPTVLNQGFEDPIDTTERGRLNNYQVLLGGVRLTQYRSATGECAVSLLAGLAGACHPVGSTSTEPFGDDIVAEAYNVTDAFVASELDDDISFEFWLNYEDDYTTSQEYLTGLQAAGWLDESTESVSIQVAVANGEIGFLGSVALTSTFDRGGLVDNAFTVVSTPLDPYYQYPHLLFLDILMVIYFCYLLLSALRRAVRTCRTCGGYRGSGGGLEALSSCAAELLGWWRLIDYATVACMLICLVTFGSMLGQLQRIRTSIDPQATPETAGGGPSDLQLKIFAACDTYYTFKTAAVFLIIALSFRLLKYCAFQPRLAVFTDAMARAWEDIVHFCIVFTVILVMFGVWGHFFFGNQAVEWSTVVKSMGAVIRFSQFDYDLVSMQQVSYGMADFYYCALMLGVTNITFWIVSTTAAAAILLLLYHALFADGSPVLAVQLFSIILEAHSEVRSERLKGPTVWEEAAAFAMSIPRMVNIRLFRGYKQFGPRGSQLGGDATWTEVTQVVTNGALKDTQVITADQLRTHLGLTQASAAALLADVLVTASREEEDAEGVFYGAGLPGSAPLPPEVLAQLARLDKRSFLSARGRSRSAVFLAAADAHARSMSAMGLGMSRPYSGSEAAGGGGGDSGLSYADLGPGAGGAAAAAASAQTIQQLTQAVAALSAQVGQLQAALART